MRTLGGRAGPELRHRREQEGHGIQIKERIECHPEFTWRLATALLGIYTIDDPRRELLGHPICLKDLHQTLQESKDITKLLARPLVIASHTLMLYNRQGQQLHINIHDSRSVKEAQEDPATRQARQIITKTGWSYSWDCDHTQEDDQGGIRTAAAMVQFAHGEYAFNGSIPKCWATLIPRLLHYDIAEEKEVIKPRGNAEAMRSWGEKQSGGQIKGTALAGAGAEARIDIITPMRTPVIINLDTSGEITLGIRAEKIITIRALTTTGGPLVDSPLLTINEDISIPLDTHHEASCINELRGLVSRCKGLETFNVPENAHTGEDFENQDRDHADKARKEIVALHDPTSQVEHTRKRNRSQTTQFILDYSTAEALCEHGATQQQPQSTLTEEQGLHMGEKTTRRLQQVHLGGEREEDCEELQERAMTWEVRRKHATEACWTGAIMAYLGTEDEGQHNTEYRADHFMTLMKRRKKHMYQYKPRRGNPIVRNKAPGWMYIQILAEQHPTRKGIQATLVAGYIFP